MKKTILLAVILMMAAPIAARADADDMRALAAAKISLVEAIEAAEKSVGGKAVDASIEDDTLPPQYDVSIIRDGKYFDVQVNGIDGSIINAREEIDD
jgi:uncharacterized membrane protein YkoI